MLTRTVDNAGARAVQNATNCSTVSLHVQYLEVHAQCAQGICVLWNSSSNCMYCKRQRVIAADVVNKCSYTTFQSCAVVASYPISVHNKHS